MRDAGVAADHDPRRGDDGGQLERRRPAGQDGVGPQPRRVRHRPRQLHLGRAAGDDHPGPVAARCRATAANRSGGQRRPGNAAPGCTTATSRTGGATSGTARSSASGIGRHPEPLGDEPAPAAHLVLVGVPRGPGITGAVEGQQPRRAGARRRRRATPAPSRAGRRRAPAAGPTSRAARARGRAAPRPPRRSAAASGSRADVVASTSRWSGTAARMARIAGTPVSRSPSPSGRSTTATGRSRHSWPYVRGRGRQHQLP